MGIETRNLAKEAIITNPHATTPASGQEVLRKQISPDMVVGGSPFLDSFSKIYF